MRSRMGDEAPVTDVQQEEDKAKMLLGAKLLVRFARNGGCKFGLGGQLNWELGECSRLHWLSVKRSRIGFEGVYWLMCYRRKAKMLLGARLLEQFVDLDADQVEKRLKLGMGLRRVAKG